MIKRQASYEELQNSLGIAKLTPSRAFSVGALRERYEDGVLSVSYLGEKPYIVDFLDGGIYEFASNEAGPRIRQQVLASSIAKAPGRGIHILNAERAIEQATKVESHLNHGLVVAVGIDRLVPRGTSIELQLIGEQEPLTFMRATDAINHIIKHRQHNSERPFEVWPRPKG